MKRISDLLAKFSKFGAAESFLKANLERIIKLKTGLDSDQYTIVLKNNQIHLKGSPALRERVFMKRDSILEDLQKVNSPERPFNLKTKLKLY